MSAGTVFAKVNEGMNHVVVPLAGSRRSRWIIDRLVVVVSYTGRRSHRRFSTPVFYRKQGDQLTIRVAMADEKNWWRNFEGEGGPISLSLRGKARSGHAIARRDAKGAMRVTVELQPL